MTEVPVPVHLLVSVYLTPDGLNRYRLGWVQDDSDLFFRLSRFLTSCASLAQLPWTSVKVGIEVDPKWAEHLGAIQKQVGALFPQVEFLDSRLKFRPEWYAVSTTYADGDVILLQGNDDHAYVAADSRSFDEITRLMSSEPRYALGAVTHFPEMQGMVSRWAANSPNVSAAMRSIEAGYAVGTTLVRGDFFKSWWTEGKFDDNEFVPRPDNPFGRSVKFEPKDMLVANREIMRHMDGYSHVGCFRPLAPLRNTHTFAPGEDRQESTSSGKWLVGQWPGQILAYSRGLADLHGVLPPTSDGHPAIRTSVATLQAAWALRWAPSRLREIVDPTHRAPLWQVFLAGLVATLTWPVVRNIPDALLDLAWRALSRVGTLFGRDPRPLPFEVWYNGWLRTALKHRTRERMK